MYKRQVQYSTTESWRLSVILLQAQSKEMGQFNTLQLKAKDCPNVSLPTAQSKEMGQFNTLQLKAGECPTLSVYLKPNQKRRVSSER